MYRIPLKDFKDTILNFTKKVRFTKLFTKRFTEIVLEELEKREVAVSKDTIRVGERVLAIDQEIVKIKETIKQLSSPVTIKLMEKDIEELEVKKLSVTNLQNKKEKEKEELQLELNYTRYFMEHLEKLLLRSDNPHQNAAMFGLIFDTVPTYEDLLFGTPDLACIFELNDEFNKTKELSVSQLSQNWNTYADYFMRVYQTFNRYDIQVPNYVYV